MSYLFHVPLAIQFSAKIRKILGPPTAVTLKLKDPREYLSFLRASEESQSIKHVGIEQSIAAIKLSAMMDKN